MDWQAVVRGKGRKIKSCAVSMKFPAVIEKVMFSMKIGTPGSKNMVKHTKNRGVTRRGNRKPHRKERRFVEMLKK